MLSLKEQENENGLNSYIGGVRTFTRYSKRLNGKLRSLTNPVP